MMQVHEIAMNCRHNRDFIIDRPKGRGDDLLVIFKTNARMILSGEEILVPHDSMILYSVGTPQYYKSAGEVYVDHFLHFDANEMDPIHRTSGVRFNTLLPLKDTGAVEDVLRMISREYFSFSENKERSIDLLIRLLLFKIADSIATEEELGKRRVHGSELNALRADMYSNAGKFNRVGQLADRMNLSLAHFQELYKEQFGVSCYEDLLTAKVRLAQYYLNNTALSIQEIARLCGYENQECFMRRFKQRMGTTPKGYRNESDSHWKG